MSHPEWSQGPGGGDSPCYGVHEEEVVVRRARVSAVVHVLLLGGVLDVLDDQLHLLAQIRLRLGGERYDEA